MKRANRVLRGLFIAASLATTIPAALLFSSVAQAESVRPEVGNPLNAASAAIKARNFKDAAAHVNEADAVSGKTPYESYLIASMRFTIAQGSSDTAGEAAAFEAISASGKSSSAQRIPMVQAIAGSYYHDREFAKAATWYQRYYKEGGTDSSMRIYLVQSLYQAGDCSAVSRELGPGSTAEGGRAPSEDELQMLLSCYERGGDKNGYAAAMERLVTLYPKKEYWLLLLQKVQAKPAFSDRLDLDLYRLRLATGNLSSGKDLSDMAQLAVEAGTTGEAKQVVDLGFSTGVLGTGPEADRNKRLRDLITKQLADDQKTATQREGDAIAAKDGDALVTLGFSLVMNGQADKGLTLMEQGIAKDSLRHPEDARLHLGVAYIHAGKKAKGRDVLRLVKGADGTADVARLWLLYTSTGS